MDPASSRGPARPPSRKASGAGDQVIVAEQGWRRAIRGVEALAARATLAAGGNGVVVLASDTLVKSLNARHRGRNKATNVLTFEPLLPGTPGEIFLALGVIRREALAAGRRPADHLAHLVVHGALHLRGHDHIRVGDARRMEMAEARILHRLGVANPWKPSPS